MAMPYITAWRSAPSVPRLGALRFGHLGNLVLKLELCMRVLMQGAGVAGASGDDVCAAGDARCACARGESAGVFEILLKPQAYIAEILGEGTETNMMHIVERLGHMVLKSPVDFVGTYDFKPAKFFQDLCATPWWGLCRCFKHSWDSLRDAYILDDGAYTMLEDFYDLMGQANVYDKPYAVESNGPLGLEFAKLFASSSAWQDGLAERASRFRHGWHIYPGCNTLNSMKHVHKNKFDLPWLLAPLWNEEVPKRVSFVNFGCRGFEESDPLSSLQQTGTEFAGLCVDADGVELAKARQRLKSHAAMNVIEAFLKPGNVPGMLREFVPEGFVDILKVDIDSFDAGVLDAALDVLGASIVIAEFQFVFPPPFLFARHYSSEMELGSAAFFGASLSYLVEHLARRSFFFYKMNELDAIWLHSSVAERFAAADREEGRLAFPVDEWACYLQTPFYLGDSRVHVPLEYTREWLLDSDVHNALQHIWGNLTKLGPNVPFALDVAQRVFGTPSDALRRR